MVTNAVAPDQLGGLQRYVRELAGAVAKRDVPVTIVAKAAHRDTPAEETLDDGVRLRRFAVPGRSAAAYALAYPIASFRAVWRALGAERGLIHVHYPLQGVPVACGARGYVHTFHAPIYRELLPERSYRLPQSLEQTLVATTRAAEALVARRASATIMLSEFMRGELSLIASESARGATLIPAGLDTDFFSPGPPIADPLAAADGPLLFTARRLVPRTGVRELVQAMPEVVSRIPGTRLVIAGDGPLRSEVQQLIEQRSLAGNVFLLGRVSDEQLRGWYRAASLFVLPTQELEGFGLSTVEALACGTPAVGTPAGSTPEVLGSLDGRLVAQGVTPDQLASTVVDVLGNDQLMALVRERARGHVVPAMSWSAIAERHLEIYERLAAASTPRYTARL
jgi:glycosyltransferase involved in cell wall biosynthesis